MVVPGYLAIEYSSLSDLHQSVKIYFIINVLNFGMGMAVLTIRITEANESQRVDNFLLTYCKGVPKTRLYRALRKGEVRVNQKRIKPEYRLQLGDVVRIPPIRMVEKEELARPSASIVQKIEESILQETKNFILLNKPAGIPVHGGTGIKTGVIEAIRALRPLAKYLELAHRIDRDTSGCLLLAKKRSVLVAIHERWRSQAVKKHYFALLRGEWQGEARRVQAPLRKNHLLSGERIVVVDTIEGKPSETIFKPICHYRGATLVEALILTGRTHQIRVHAAHIGHPIAGDDKYGDRDFNKFMKNKGLNRLFLHASSIYCHVPELLEEYIGLCAPLSSELRHCLDHLSRL